MDSTQIASHILDASRLPLLVEAVQRLWRVLNEGDQARCQADCAPYAQHSSGQYVYHVQGQAAARAHVQQVAGLLQRLLVELAPAYAHETRCN